MLFVGWQKSNGLTFCSNCNKLLTKTLNCYIVTFFTSVTVTVTLFLFFCNVPMTGTCLSNDRFSPLDGRRSERGRLFLMGFFLWTQKWRSVDGRPLRYFPHPVTLKEWRKKGQWNPGTLNHCQVRFLCQWVACSNLSETSLFSSTPSSGVGKCTAENGHECRSCLMHICSYVSYVFV